jgi:glutaryl-CoA dehydrogenase
MSDFYRIDDLLNPDERALRDRVRAFCDREVAPLAADAWEHAELPRAWLTGLGELGVCGGTIRGHGCPGLSAVGAGLLSQELARGDGSLQTFFAVQSGLVMAAIDLLGSDAQRNRWLPPLARLEAVGAFALTEPEHGSDAVLLETTATRDAEGWRLDGRKRWIGNATFADLLVVWARESESGEVGGFLVERDAPGLRVAPIQGKVSQRAVAQANVELEAVRVPDAARLPGARTFRDTARVLRQARGGIAWAAMGHAAAAYEAALAYTKERRTFARPLASMQLVQAKLVGMVADLTAGQLVCLRLSQMQADGNVTDGQASLAKLHCARAARRIVADARDLLGGNGILLDRVVARHFADLEGLFTYEGTDAIQTLVVGREITGLSAFAPR